MLQNNDRKWDFLFCRVLLKKAPYYVVVTWSDIILKARWSEMAITFQEYTKSRTVTPSQTPPILID